MKLVFRLLWKVFQLFRRFCTLKQEKGAARSLSCQALSAFLSVIPKDSVPPTLIQQIFPLLTNENLLEGSVLKEVIVFWGVFKSVYGGGFRLVKFFRWC